MVGVCLPNTCNESDTNNLFTWTLWKTAMDNVYVKSEYDVNNPVPMTSGAISAITTLIVLLIIVAIGTSSDIYHNTKRENNQRQHATGDIEMEQNRTVETSESNPSLNVGIKDSSIFRILTAFSVVKITKLLLYKPTDKKSFVCLNGLRVRSNVWAILGHTYFIIRWSLSNQNYAQSTLFNRLTFQPILNGSFSTDTFLFLTGLLVSLQSLVVMKSNGHLNWIHYFLHMLFRILPLCAFILFLYTKLMHYHIHVPFKWAKTGNEELIYSKQPEYYNQLWSNLLSINNSCPNYGDPGCSCMVWTWYLAIDFQCSIFIAPPILLLFHTIKALGIVYSLLFSILCVGIRGGLAISCSMTVYGELTKHLEDMWL